MQVTFSSLGWQGIPAKAWTTDKMEAEARYKAALRRKVARLKKQQKTLETLINTPPQYAERP